MNVGDRKNRNGIIIRINGNLVYVKPTWCNWEIELYKCEIKEEE